MTSGKYIKGVYMTSFFIKNKWVILAWAVMAVLTYFYIEKLQSKINALKAEKISLSDKLEISNSSIDTLKRDIQNQNAAIDILKVESDKKEEASKQAVKVAILKAETFKTRANKILYEPMPANITECEASNLLINREIKNASK